jgi:hypothetical protein
VSLVRHAVPAPLRPFVAAAHGYRSPALPDGLHRGLPSRHLTLVVELAAPLRVSGTGLAVAAHAVVGGLHTRAALIDATRPRRASSTPSPHWPRAPSSGCPPPSSPSAPSTWPTSSAGRRTGSSTTWRPPTAGRSGSPGSTPHCSTGSAAMSHPYRPRSRGLAAGARQRRPLPGRGPGRARRVEPPAPERAVPAGHRADAQAGGADRPVRGHPPAAAGPAASAAGRGRRPVRLRRPAAPGPGVAGPRRVQRGDLAARGAPVRPRQRPGRRRHPLRHDSSDHHRTHPPSGRASASPTSTPGSASSPRGSASPSPPATATRTAPSRTPRPAGRTAAASCSAVAASPATGAPSDRRASTSSRPSRPPSTPRGSASAARRGRGAAGAARHRLRLHEFGVRDADGNLWTWAPTAAPDRQRRGPGHQPDQAPCHRTKPSERAEPARPG